MEEVPAGLKNAAIAQIVAGVINICIAGPLVWFTAASVCSILTFFIGGLGGMCGMLGCLLVPLGFVEILVGVLSLTNPKGFGSASRILAFLEVASILCGGLISAIVGAVVLSMTGSDEVKLYLEA